MLRREVVVRLTYAVGEGPRPDIVRWFLVKEEVQRLQDNQSLFDGDDVQPERYEKRSATAVAVMLTSRDPVSRTELTLTENISGRGARVVTKTLGSASDSLVIKSLEGDLQSEARVIYRQPVRENVYAIGLELIARTGNWRTKSS